MNSSRPPPFNWSLSSLPPGVRRNRKFLKKTNPNAPNHSLHTASNHGPFHPTRPPKDHNVMYVTTQGLGQAIVKHTMIYVTISSLRRTHLFVLKLVRAPWDQADSRFLSFCKHWTSDGLSIVRPILTSSATTTREAIEAIIYVQQIENRS